VLPPGPVRLMMVRGKDRRETAARPAAAEARAGAGCENRPNAILAVSRRMFAVARTAQRRWPFAREKSAAG